MSKPAWYIKAASTVSHQPTFGNPGFSASLEPLDAAHTLISPDYKAYIDSGLLRRMSKILRMSVACSKDCIQQAGGRQPDAIIVGTGLGCLQDTEKFLNTSLTVEGLLPPTSFIQSTHNTMAGQISLSIGNHGYNMTHTQNTLSFEHALLDATMLLAEGHGNVLVGAADEHIDILDSIADRLGFEATAALTSAASFFILSAEKKGNTVAQLIDVHTAGLTDGTDEEVGAFLARNGMEEEDVDLVLYAGSELEGAGRNVNYLPLAGVYATASAFALHYAVDLLTTDGSVRNVLICNSLLKNNLGLMLIQAVEA